MNERDAAQLCPDDDQLVAFFENSLTADALGNLEHHIGTCTTCRQVVASLAASAATISGGGELAVGTMPASAGDEPLALGSDVGDRYRVERVIGRGGMATVYVARDRSLSRTVALKLHRGGGHDARIYQEAVAMARLAHPNVVTVFEIGEHRGQRFVAMELVAGGTLRDWLQRERRTWRAIVEMFIAIGNGLVAVHRCGLVHRDFKPENVLVDSDGRPRVTDFGLVQADGIAARESARMLARAEAAATDHPDGLTVTGAAVGTPAYMAPEQLTAGAVDARSDQFAFCVSLWEALYDRRPFSGATMEELYAAISAGDVHPSTKRRVTLADRSAKPIASRARVPARLHKLLLRGLAARADDRFPDMPALLVGLRKTIASRAPRRIALAVVAAGALAAGSLWAASAIGDRNAAAACDRRVTQVAASSGPFAHVELALVFAATGESYAPAAAAHTIDALSRADDALVAVARHACTADEPPAVARARARCIDDHARALSQVTTELIEGTKQSTESGPQTAWGLVQAQPCASAESLSETESTWRLTDADLLVYRRASDLHQIAKYKAALAALQPAMDAARARNDSDTELTFLLLAADCTINDGRDDASVPMLVRAAALAEARGRDVEGAQALASLAGVLGDHQGDDAQSRKYLELARAKLVRIGGVNSTLATTLDFTEARIDLRQFQLDAADQLLAHARDLAVASFGPDHPQLVPIYGTMSEVAGYRGRIDDELAFAREALARSRASLGEDHPQTAGTLQTLAQALDAAGKYADARDAAAAGDAVMVKLYGENHPSRLSMLAVLQGVERELKHYDASRAAIQRALAIEAATHGANGYGSGMLHAYLSQTELEAGNRDAALAESATAMAIVETVLKPDDPALSVPLENRARALLAVGQPAVDVAERCYHLTVAVPGGDPNLATEIEVLVADALWASGDHAAAQARAHHAQATAVANTDTARAVATWLANHP